MRIRQWVLIGLYGILIVGCTTTTYIRDGYGRANIPAEVVRDRYGFNVFPYEAANNPALFTQFLEWLEQQGFRKEARMLCPITDTGEMIERDWFPTLRQRGWRISCIAAQHSIGVTADQLPQMAERLRKRLADWSDIITLGVEPANEPWANLEHSGWTLALFSQWVALVEPIIHQAGLPMIVGNIGADTVRATRWDYYRQTTIDWSRVDIISFNAAEHPIRKDGINYLASHVPGWDTKQKWVMEAHWQHAQLDWFQPVRVFIYTCSGDLDHPRLNRCPDFGNTGVGQ